MNGPQVVTGTPLATAVISAANFNCNYQYGGFNLTMGPSQPVVDPQGQIVASVPQWVATAQFSPQGIVQLHALLGQLLDDYQREFGQIPRPTVLFHRNSKPEGEESGNVVTLGGLSVPASALRASDPPPPQKVDPPQFAGYSPPPAPPANCDCGAGSTPDNPHARWCRVATDNGAYPDGRAPD